MDWSKSAAKTKSRGERGSPCLTPLLQWKVLPGTPFNRTADVPELRMESIQDLHFYAKTRVCHYLQNHFALYIIESFLEIKFQDYNLLF